MTTVNSELYFALMEIGVSEEKARKAAEAMSSTEPRFDALDRKIDALDRKIDRLDAKVDLLGANLNAKIDRVDAKIDRVETSLRGDMTLIKWMFGVVVGIAVAVALKTFSH